MSTSNFEPEEGTTDQLRMLQQLRDQRAAALARKKMYQPGERVETDKKDK